MQIFKKVEAIPHEDDISDLIATVALGDAMERAVQEPTSPFGAMIIKARESFVDAQKALLETDLNTTAGIEQARSLQAEARRYMDLCRWITDAWDDRDQASEALDSGEEEAAVLELMEAQNGQRAKPAPDA